MKDILADADSEGWSDLGVRMAGLTSTVSVIANGTTKETALDRLVRQLSPAGMTSGERDRTLRWVDVTSAVSARCIEPLVAEASCASAPRQLHCIWRWYQRYRNADLGRSGYLNGECGDRGCHRRYYPYILHRR